MLKKLVAVFTMLMAGVAFAAVDANKATMAELDSVNGIGPVTSKSIATERDKRPFKDWEDFSSRISGIGETRAAKLSAAGLTIDGASYKAPAGGSKTVTEKVKDGTRHAVDKTREVAREAKDKVTGK